MRGGFPTFILNWTFSTMKHVTTFAHAFVLLLLVGVGVWQPAAAQTSPPPVLSHEVHATSAFGTTYRVYANFQNANDRVGAVFAQTNASTGVIDELSISTTTSFYQNTETGSVNFGHQVMAFALGFYPNLALDSWFTIGVTNSAEGTLGNIVGMADALVAFNAGNGFVINDGTWTVTGANQLSTAPAFCLAGSDLKVLLGQFTVANTAGGGSGHIALNFNVQWFPHNAGIGGEIRTFDLALNTASSSPIPGCMNAAACNFDASATTDNGSCIVPTGCDTCASGALVDGDTDNDGVCDVNEIVGCQTVGACNYNAAATNPGACIIPGPCDSCSGGALVDGDADNDGVCNANELVGCMTAGACNFNASATDSGPCVFATGCDTCSGGAVVDGDTDNDGVCNANEVPGCTISTACNYNSAATDNDGSCIVATGCDFCSGGAIADGDADNDGVCNANEVVGCMTLGACNYNSAATDPGPCTLPTGCEFCSGGTIADGDADDDGVCDVDEIVGCQTSTACNYNSAATNAGTCTFATGCDTCVAGSVVDGDVDNDGVCDGDEVAGCADATACNYNDAATDPGTCNFPANGYDCAGACLVDTDGDGICNSFEVEGCTDATACNFMAGATDSNASLCVYPPAGTTCSGAILSDWDGDSIPDLYEIEGCMSSSATNYNPAATDDDGSCTWAFNRFLGLSYERTAVNGIPGKSTYRVYANFSAGSDSVEVVAAYGSVNAAATPPTNDPWEIFSTQPFYQDAAGSLLAENVLPALFPMVPSLQYDSWLTLGGGPGVATGLTLVQPASNPFAAFASSGGNVNVTDQVGATMFYTPGASPYAHPISNKMLIGQFTTSGVVSLQYNFQMAFNNITYRITDVEIQFPIQGPGCMDEDACNYLSTATVDDGSCTYPSSACRNCAGTCLADANSDGVCDCEVVLGCTDDDAINYDSDANTDDASCLYEGCKEDFTACNYDPLIDQNNDDLCVYPQQFCDCGGDCEDGDYEGDGIAEVDEVEGCTSVSATNFDPLATNDDGGCVWNPNQFNGLEYDVIPNGMAGGFTTYRVYAKFTGDAEVIALFGGETPTGGSPGLPWLMQSTGGTFYQNLDAGSGTANLISPFLYTYFPGLQYDSWFTIGAEPGEPSDLAVAFMSGPTGALAQWNTSGTFNTNAGAIFVTPGSLLDQGAADAEGRVLLGQFTTNGVGYGIFNLQYLDSTGVARIVQDVEIIFPPMSPGCQNPAAVNYDPDSTFPDPSMCIIPGCTDPLACNYYDDANFLDGSCILPEGCETCTGETDGTGTVVDNDSDDDTVCDDDEVVGCQDEDACNFNAAATDAAPCVFADAENCEICSGATDGSGTVLDIDADNDGVCDPDEIVGCQDEDACNYHALATDAATCSYADAENCEICSGDTDGSGEVLDNDADNDGVCNPDEIVGCQVSTACNYNVNATDEGSCLYANTSSCEACSGATDGTGTVLDLDADNDGVCNADEVVGCQINGATSYNPLATDPGICSGCNNPAADNYNPLDQDNTLCEIGGCAYEQAMNYNPQATYDNLSCVFSCTGDLNGDGSITVEDLLNLFQVYGTNCPD